MRLLDFEEYIDPVIRDRGFDYFTNGHILKIQQMKRGFYLEVQGTSLYEVVVELGANERITYSNCNCPNISNPICKHQVAAFYALREYMAN